MDYTDLYNFNTDSGMIVPAVSSVKSGIETKFKEIFGTDLDVTEETPVGRLIEALTVLVHSTCGVTAQSANQFNIDYATGIYLDSLGRIYDIERYPGTKTRIPIVVTVTTSNAVVPAGSLIADANENLYSIDNDLSVDSFEGTSATVNGTATAVEYGPIDCPAGTATVIQSSVIGWTDVSNGAPLQIGSDQESDASFRERIKQTRPVGTGFKTSLLSAIKRIDGIDSACIEENNDTPSQVCNGVILQGHNVYVCVYGTTTSSINDAVANAIVTAKAAGVGMCHDLQDTGATLVTKTVDVGTASGVSTTVYFYRAQEITVTVDVRVTNSNFVGTTSEETIKNAVVAAVYAVDIGGILYGTDIAQAIANVAPTCGVALVYLSDTLSRSNRTNLSYLSYMKPVTATANVTVSLWTAE